MEGVTWNLWHGCHKKSEGCKFCYVYRGDSKRNIDSNIIRKTNMFDVPVRKNAKGEYKVKSGTMVWTCFSSDFLLEDADEWRVDAWNMIRTRQDLKFLFITKRIERFNEVKPHDWGNGWDNVTICCTTENQKQADFRLPIFLSLPIKHKVIICEPLLEEIDLEKYLNDEIEEVVAGGESGYNVRPCDYNWILKIREDCIKHNVTFRFKQTGTYFKKNNITYFVKRNLQHSQARKANINFNGKHESHLK